MSSKRDSVEDLLALARRSALPESSEARLRMNSRNSSPDRSSMGCTRTMCIDECPTHSTVSALIWARTAAMCICSTSSATPCSFNSPAAARVARHRWSRWSCAEGPG